MSANSHDIKVLNSLTEGLIDCADGYREAADQVDDPRYRQWFDRRASERLALAEEFKQEVGAKGGSPEDNGSILSKATRAFSGFAQAILGNQQSAFEMVQSSEAKLKRRFETAVEDGQISATTRETLRRGLMRLNEAETDLATLGNHSEP